MRLLAGHDESVSKWIAERTGLSFNNIALAPGVIDADGRLVGGVVLHNHTRFDVEITIFGAMTKDLVRSVARFVFLELSCERVTARIRRKNKAVIRAALKFGFRHEGLSRHLYGRGKSNDAILMGMLASDAGRFLKDMDHGTSKAA